MIQKSNRVRMREVQERHALCLPRKKMAGHVTMLSNLGNLINDGALLNNHWSAIQICEGEKRLVYAESAF